MGPLYIWIAASIAFGAVTAAIYIWICRGNRRPHLMQRAVIAFIAYTVVALFIVRILYKIAGE